MLNGELAKQPAHAVDSLRVPASYSIHEAKLATSTKLFIRQPHFDQSFKEIQKKKDSKLDGYHSPLQNNQKAYGINTKPQHLPVLYSVSFLIIATPPPVMLSFFRFSFSKTMYTNANDFYGSSLGSENFYQNKLFPIIYTDGVKELADCCEAYWLIDLVSSHQMNKVVMNEPFQVWQLKRVEGSEYAITATDGNKKQIAAQQIPYSDFKYDQATLWVVDGCLMLPKEY